MKKGYQDLAEVGQLPAEVGQLLALDQPKGQGGRLSPRLNTLADHENPF